MMPETEFVYNILFSYYQLLKFNIIGITSYEYTYSYVASDTLTRIKFTYSEPNPDGTYNCFYIEVPRLVSKKQIYRAIIELNKNYKVEHFLKDEHILDVLEKDLYKRLESET